MNNRYLMHHLRVIILLITLSYFSLSKAYNFETNSVYYNIIDNNTVAVTSNKVSSNSYSSPYYGNVVIPSTVSYGGKEYDVVAIEKSAFEEQSNMISLTMPNSILTIGTKAFKGCANLVSVDISNSIAKLDDEVFMGCSGLTSLNIPESITKIGKSAFSGCSNLQSITLPNSISDIGSEAFKDCKSLKIIDIPKTLTHISFGMFWGCSSLKSIIIPSSITGISDAVFHNCSNLTTLIIEDGDTSIYLGNGYEHNPLAPSTSYIKGCLFNTCPISTVYMGRDIDYYSVNGKSPFYDKYITKLTLGPKVTTIPDGAFWSRSKFATLIIPANVQSIGRSAFLNCDIKELIIEDSPDNLTLGPYDDKYRTDHYTIGEYASDFTYQYGVFSNNSIQSIYLGRNILQEKIDRYTIIHFTELAQLSKITFGKYVNAIDKNTFFNCRPSIVESYSYNISNILNSGLDLNCTPTLILKEHDSFSGISNSNLLFFDKIKIQDDKNNYALVNISNKIKITDCIYQEGDYSIVPFTECVVKSDLYAKYLFRDNDITSQVNSQDGFKFTPSLYISQNTFCTYGDKLCAGSVKEVRLSQAGSLFDAVGLQDIENIEVLTISGDLNGTDILTINRMKSLKYLNLSESNIVAGGKSYYGNLLTSDNTIGTDFFKDIRLEFLYLPKSATTISNYAFRNQNALRNSDIPEFISSIGNEAYSGCKSLKNFTIPRNVNYVGMGMLYDCNGIKELFIEDGENTLQMGIFYTNNIQTIYLGRNTPTSTFECFSNLQDITIGKYVTEIYGNQFANCKNLTTVTLNSRINRIGEYAFQNCNHLSTIILPNTVSSIGISAFEGCTGLESVNIPNSLQTISERAFYDCSDLETIEFPESIETIGNNAFYNCTKLKSLTIPASVTYIGDYAFKGCVNIYDLNILDSRTSLRMGRNMLPNTIKKLYLGRSTASYHEDLFSYCNLIEVEIGEYVSQIGESFFEGCNKLEHIYLPNSITSIKAKAFKYCEKLDSIDLPDSVKTIGDYVFANCSSLSKISLPRLIESIGTGMFQECINLESVDLGDKIKNLKNYAFKGCYNLTSINLPDLMTSIGEECFAGCTSLCDINIPADVSNIGKGAFYECSSITKVKLPDKITYICANTFYGTAIREIYIPESVIEIGTDAFAGNNNIEKVVSLNVIPPIMYNSTFDMSIKKSAKLHVRKGSLVDYWLDPQWKEFNDMSENIICLEAIPDVVYGDDDIDLSQYAPNNLDLQYETSNSEIIFISGSKMRILGAGEATIGAILPGDEGEMELIGQLRQITIMPSNLEITVADICIEEGVPLPEFTYIAKGLQYDDRVEDIDVLPLPICEIDEDSAPGEYDVCFTEGYDKNYNITTIPAKIVIRRTSADVESSLDIDSSSQVSVYSVDGKLIYTGTKSEMYLLPGINIICKEGIITKVIIR